MAKLGITPGELVLSFRSTEFVDDAARDNQATNAMEIAEVGFALGQIADMEKWYAELRADPTKIPAGASLSVTGYSLGGHLATAFNLLRAQEIATAETPKLEQTITFNKHQGSESNCFPPTAVWAMNDSRMRLPA
jgi:hypothetical protein